MRTPESTLRIEDYGLIGDCTTAALVGRNGSIDWLCWPRFDRSTCFAALLGDSNHGRWSLCPVDHEFKSSRRYRGETMLLETEFETASGRFAVIDFMPINGAPSSVIRIVEGRRGEVAGTGLARALIDFGFGVSGFSVRTVLGEEVVGPASGAGFLANFCFFSLARSCRALRSSLGRPMMTVIPLLVSSLIRAERKPRR